MGRRALDMRVYCERERVRLACTVREKKRGEQRHDSLVEPLEGEENQEGGNSMGKE